MEDTYKKKKLYETIDRYTPRSTIPQEFEFQTEKRERSLEKNRNRSCRNFHVNQINLYKNLDKRSFGENNGTKKFVFYGIDDDFKPWWCGTMKEIYYGSYTDSGSSCGIKRHIHINHHTKLDFKKNNSIEVCWREALTDKEWNEKLGILGCLYCDYKSNFIDFIRIKKSQAIK